MTRRLAAVLVVAVVVMVLGVAWMVSHRQQVSSATATPTGVASVATIRQVPVASPTTAATIATVDECDGETGFTFVEDLTVAERRQVERFAVAFMSAFARPADGSFDRWWARVAPYLTAEAAEEYRWVDPANITFTRVTGSGVIQPSLGESHLVRDVAVPTDDGVFIVHVWRADDRLQVSGFTAESDR